MLGSLTVLPAVLSKLGDRVEKGRVPFIGRLRQRSRRRVARSGARSSTACCGARWSRCVLAGGLLVALAIPALGMHTADAGRRRRSRATLAVIQTYDRIQAAFPGDQLPADVAVEADDVTLTAGAARRSTS